MLRSVRLAFLVTVTLACGCVQTTHDVPVEDAARLSRHYDGRVTVLAIHHEGELRDVVGSLVEGGRYVVTSDNETITVDPSDHLRVRIDYVNGDTSLDNRSVHKRISAGWIGGGAAMLIGGALILSAVAVSRCNTSDDPPLTTGKAPTVSFSVVSDHDACVFALGTLGFVSVASILTGLSFIGVGTTPRITFAPRVAPHSGALAATLAF